MKITKISISTKKYTATETGVFPCVLDPEGCYPYSQFSETSSNPEPYELSAVELENDYLKAIVCPELGGKLLSLFDKTSGKESLYRNDVIKPNRILPRWGWFSGGIEFNFPIAHSPTSLEKVGYQIFETSGRISIQVGEKERKYGLNWIVELSLGLDEKFLTQRFFIKNDDSVKRPYTLWNNAAVRSTPESKYLFPQAQKVFRHAHVADWVSWPEIGEKEKDYDRMTGLFWEAQGYAFGVWHPEENIGLMHIADPAIYPGMKMWTYGVGKHADWPTLFTDDGRPYAEIQSGAVMTQDQELELIPGEEKSFTCYWQPIVEEVDISTVGLPQTAGEFPECSWIDNEHISELVAWNTLRDNCENLEYIKENNLFENVPVSPPPPLPEYEALLRIAHLANPAKWRAHLATYLCAIAEFDEQRLNKDVDYKDILTLLESPKNAEEFRLRALILWRRLNDSVAACVEFKEACSRTDELQVLIEYDCCLSELADVDSRKMLFEKVSSDSQLWTERKIDFLLMQDKAFEARELLLATNWDRYHLRHTRYNLYKNCQEKLNEPIEITPEELGEDDMCDWGAYRPQAK